MWFRRVPSHLPITDGPYVPGCTDVMTEYSPEGCFMRLYYPSTTSKDTKTHILSKKWIKWFPEVIYLNGFARVILIWNFLFKLVVWLFSGTAYIPGLYGEEIKLSGEPNRLKVVVFSHGLGGSRFFYSTTCMELASRGFLVAAIEHRDESACATYYYKNNRDVTEDIKTWVTFRRVGLGSDHHRTRHNQVLKRSQEVQKVIDLLYKINAGDPVNNIVSTKDQSFKLDSLKNQMDLNNLVMMGHSFGAATALVVLANDKRTKIGVILDAWMFPVKNILNLDETVTQPLLFVNTQTFHIASNLSAMNKVINADPKIDRKVFTIKHTTHENQTDSPYVVGYWLNWFMKKLKPIEATRINNHLILDFLNKHIGFPADNTESDEHLKSQSHNYTEGATKPWYSVGSGTPLMLPLRKGKS